MKPARRLLAIALLVALGLAVWWLRPSEARRVRRQLDRLSECVTKPEGEGAALMAIKMNRLGELLGASVEIKLHEFPGNGTLDGAELASQVARFRPGYRVLELTCFDPDLEITGDRATLDFTARLRAAPGDSPVQDETRAIQAGLQRDPDGTWRFTRFAEIRVLRR